MKDILTASFIKELCFTASNMYRLGWDERNGGNISVMLEEDQLSKYLDLSSIIRTIPMGFDAGQLNGKHFLVTGTGKYFKNIEKEPSVNLGIIRINNDKAELLWGYEDDGKFTSELPTHLMSHASRLSANPNNRIIMHSHPTYTIAMNAVCPIDERDFTHRLWQSNTEAIVVFPDGVSILPSMVCGTNEIGIATADKMKSSRLVLWSNHGIYGSGETLDEAFGLVETVEKTAQIYMIAHSVCVMPNVIPDSILLALANRFGVIPKYPLGDDKDN